MATLTMCILLCLAIKRLAVVSGLLAAIFCRVNQGLANRVFVVIVQCVVKIDMVIILQLGGCYFRSPNS